jgi:hypothetical protein
VQGGGISIAVGMSIIQQRGWAKAGGEERGNEGAYRRVPWEIGNGIRQ